VQGKKKMLDLDAYVHDYNTTTIINMTVVELNEYYLKTAKGSEKIWSLNFMFLKDGSQGLRSYRCGWLVTHFPKIDWTAVPEKLWIKQKGTKK